MGCNNSYGCSSQPTGCVDKFGCIPGLCPDHVIRRHDTKPAFKVKMEDCDGPMNLTDLILEATMWAKGKLKISLDIADTYFSLADDIGFNQIMVGDIIIMDQTRNPEYMLVTGFDEDDRLVHVARGYHGTSAQKWKRGTALRIIKFMNAQAQTEMIYQDILEVDGSTSQNVLTDSFFIYEWGPNDTCLPGCYYFEFKLIKMGDGIIEPEVDDSDLTTEVFSPSVISFESPSQIVIPDVPTIPSFIEIGGISVIPSFTSPSTTFGCGLGDGIEWIRRFPVSEEGFIIKIVNSITQER